jgi:hypothetical protein
VLSIAWAVETCFAAMGWTFQTVSRVRTFAFGSARIAEFGIHDSGKYADPASAPAVGNLRPGDFTLFFLETVTNTTEISRQRAVPEAGPGWRRRYGSCDATRSTYQFVLCAGHDSRGHDFDDVVRPLTMKMPLPKGDCGCCWLTT